MRLVDAPAVAQINQNALDLEILGCFVHLTLPRATLYDIETCGRMLRVIFSFVCCLNLFLTAWARPQPKEARPQSNEISAVTNYSLPNVGLAFEHLVLKGIANLDLPSTTVQIQRLVAYPKQFPEGGTKESDFLHVHITVYDPARDKLVIETNQVKNTNQWNPPLEQPYDPSGPLRLWSWYRKGMTLQMAIDKLATRRDVGPWLKIEFVFYEIDPFSHRMESQLYVWFQHQAGEKEFWMVVGCRTGIIHTFAGSIDDTGPRHPGSGTGVFANSSYTITSV